MRILQLIDSLDTGGAERMAVNFANSVLAVTGFSGLVATRKEGTLKAAVASGVTYLYLQKTAAVDLKALMRLRSYCKKNDITHVHAHGTSYFTASLLKIAMPQIKLIWHVHDGAIASLPGARIALLKALSFLFDGIIVVNNNLKDWAKTTLHSQALLYLPNYVQAAQNPTAVKMYGIAGKRVVMVANLRHPKNHELLLRSVSQMKNALQGWTFHLIGADHNDAYSKNLRDFIARENLTDTVYLYGSQTSPHSFIAQSDIAVLTSSSEGLPLALLEYGVYGKAVVVTAVGEIPSIVRNGENGFLVDVADNEHFSSALFQLMQNGELRERFGKALRQTIENEHSEKAVMRNYISWLETL